MVLPSGITFLEVEANSHELELSPLQRPHLSRRPRERPNQQLNLVPPHVPARPLRPKVHLTQDPEPHHLLSAERLSGEVRELPENEELRGHLDHPRVVDGVVPETLLRLREVLHRHPLLLKLLQSVSIEPRSPSHGTILPVLQEQVKVGKPPLLLRVLKVPNRHLDREQVPRHLQHYRLRLVLNRLHHLHEED